MMPEIRFYLALFWRKLPLFLLIFLVFSAAGLIAAFTLPPVYRAQARLLVESAQIPGDLAETTVDVAAREQLQIFETRLLTRENLLDVANRLRPFPDQARMNPDQLVEAMHDGTQIRSSTGRDQATLMTITFDSTRPGMTAAVLDEYLTFLLEEDAQYRSARAGQTEQFFQQEVDRLSGQLSDQSAQILNFKNANADALPEGLDYRRSLQLNLQDRLAQIDREISGLNEQRDRLTQLFETTGNTTGPVAENLSTEEQLLEQLRSQLIQIEAVYAETSPRVVALRNRIAQIEESLASSDAQTPETPPAPAENDPARIIYDLQITDIETRVGLLADERLRYEDQLSEIEAAIAATPANAIALEALERDYANIQDQYNQAVDRLARASTGERIEALSRGQRVSVIEQPSIPSDPFRPNRKLVAAAGIGGGFMAGLGLIVLLELLSSSIKRPQDMVSRLGITPLATIPFTPTRREIRNRRIRRVLLIGLVFLAVPAGLWAVHVFYMPLDVLFLRATAKFGLYI